MTDHELRWQLRQLPREIEPARDLWPGISARLRQAPSRRKRPWLAVLSLAACLCLAVGLAVVLRPASAPAPAPDLAAELVQREAAALTLEYEAALLEMQAAPVPEPLAPALATLDASAGEIRRAMVEKPGSVHLLDQLKRTYSRRLALTQRAALG